MKKPPLEFLPQAVRMRYPKLWLSHSPTSPASSIIAALCAREYNIAHIRAHEGDRRFRGGGLRGHMSLG